MTLRTMRPGARRPTMPSVTTLGRGALGLRALGRGALGLRALGRGALGLSLLCVLAGCSSETSPAPDPPATSDDEPFGAYLSAYLSTSLEREDALALRWGEEVAACMKHEGFDYVPWDGVDVTVVETDPDTGSHAWTTEYGYGITSQRNVSRSDPGDLPNDPNAPIIAAMSATERAAYDAALWGDAFRGDVTAQDVSATAAPSHDGCGASASRATETDWQEDATYRRFDTDYTALLTAVDVDPAVVSTLADWRDCMADAGHPGLATSLDAQSIIQTQMDVLVSPDGSVADADTLAELRDREITLALLDRTCAIDSRVDRTRTDVQRGLEEAYVEGHRAELDAWIELDGGLAGAHGGSATKS